MTTIAFAGGGTGGHIVPNLALWDRLQAEYADMKSVWFVSERSVDRCVLEPEGHLDNVVPLSARPLSVRPIGALRFAWSLWVKARREARKALLEHDVKVLVATGGFVSAPAVLAARNLGIPVAVVHLDAVPGKANQLMQRWASERFACYPQADMQAKAIGPLLRMKLHNCKDTRAAAERLGLDADKRTLLVTGGSQGGGTVNEAVLAWACNGAAAYLRDRWQVLHIAGAKADVGGIQKKWDALEVDAKVKDFLPGLADAWACADVSVCRAGAGTVQESWLAACPCIFMPYPWHRDQHQKRNAEPLTQLRDEAGEHQPGCVIIEDTKEAKTNAASLAVHLSPLVEDPTRLDAMEAALRLNPPPDGAAQLAEWVMACMSRVSNES